MLWFTLVISIKFLNFHEACCDLFFLNVMGECSLLKREQRERAKCHGLKEGRPERFPGVDRDSSVVDLLCLLGFPMSLLPEVSRKL